MAPPPPPSPSYTGRAVVHTDAATDDRQRARAHLHDVRAVRAGLIHSCARQAVRALFSVPCVSAMFQCHVSVPCFSAMFLRVAMPLAAALVWGWGASCNASGCRTRPPRWVHRVLARHCSAGTVLASWLWQPCWAYMMHRALWNRPHHAQRPGPAHSFPVGCRR